MGVPEKKNGTVYITKYALSQGIVEAKVEFCSDRMVKTLEKYSAYYHKPDWYQAKAEAVKKAEEMRKKKLISLQKSIDKLKALTF